MASFEIPDELNDQSWEKLRPLFEKDELPPNWYDAKNQDDKTLLVMAAENGRCQEMNIFLTLIKRQRINLRPGNTIHDNIVWISIACIDAPGGQDFLECLLKFHHDFVRSHSFTAIEGERGQSPIHAAALKGALVLFKTLEGIDRAGFVEELKRCVDIDLLTPLDLAIDTGNMEMIELLMGLYVPPSSRDESGSPRENILHKALKLKTPKLEVVQIILGRYPLLLTAPNQDGKTPLQYISGKQELKGYVQSSQINDPSPNLSQITSQHSQAAVRRIKDYLVSTLFETSLSYEQLRKELGNECSGKELYFDIAFMAQPAQSFKSYLQNIKDLKIRFNSTLKAVNLPDLQCSEYEGDHPDYETFGQSAVRRFKCDRKYGVRSTNEALEVFNFLRNRGVKLVKSVNVLDCTVHPHSNSKIKACLQDFDVYSLNWRKSDLSLNLVKDVAPNVAELHLYSSGNEDVLYFWVETGLPNLKKIKRLFVTISLVTLSRVPSLKREFDPADSGAIARFKEKWETAFRKKVETCQIVLELPPNIEEIPATNGLHPPLSNSEAGKTIFTEMQEIMDFAKDLRSDSTQPTTQNARKHPIKVAILDTGLSVFDLPPMLHEPIGRSFVEDTQYGGDTHWHSPQCSHGNKLAQLIMRCNPLCKLFIAKVQSGPHQASVEISAAIRALEWIAEEKVDIVCMSWTINESAMDREIRYKFEDAIEKAGALTFCSLSDEGRLHSPGTSYPAGFKKSFKVSSFSLQGGGSKNSEHHSEAFYFPADDLDVGRLPEYFGHSTDGPDRLFKGSSYATALASGIASFMLQCIQLAFHPGTQLLTGSDQPKAIMEMMRYYKRVKMERMFISMCDQGESKRFVKPWNAFDKDWSFRTEVDTMEGKLSMLRTILGKEN